MTTASFSRHVEEDARLIILRELYIQSNGSLHDGLLETVLQSFGHNRSRDWVKTQIRKMEELGAVRATEAGSVLIAQITAAGVDHVLRRGRIEGIKQPSLGV
ncbi:VpaChn25_0724 family phage protein [Methylobacterium sp. Leaf85]|uniref:VpaChn25_0724 family phage protein n=1 Tax=Methylobacterium sp. Leaf85 TaxID=1736241 RepID=UPI0006F43C15|nr:hypothetical protein [Methylobacterium sp. Leaf85]KQO53084.1 hypothetical protein ASF08_19355 [Methylobacterium sp. Leaf85]